MRSKSSLFLTEMILSILIFSVAAAICVQIFVKAHVLSKKNEDINCAQNAAASMSEVLSMEKVDEADILKAFPQAVIETEQIVLYYDNDWRECTVKDASFVLTVHFNKNSMIYTDDTLIFPEGNKKGAIVVTSINGELLLDLPFFYHIPIEWRKEATGL